jgi:hypothetical protein
MLPPSARVEVKIEALYSAEAFVSTCERRRKSQYKLNWHFYHYLDDRRGERENLHPEIVESRSEFRTPAFELWLVERNTACYKMAASLKLWMEFLERGGGGA